MNDDRPSALDDAGGLAPALLRAGRDEWPSDESLARTLAAVGAGAAVVAVAGSAAGAGASVGTAAKGGVAVLSFGSLAKWLGIGVVSGAVVAGVAHEITPPAHGPYEPRVAAPAPSQTARAVTPTRTPLKTAPLPIEAPASEPPKPVAQHAAGDPMDQAERGAPLAAEVAMVDRARALLASGNASRALDELARYETTFPDPRLEPEVLYLRMEAHLAAGDASRAREAAERSIRLFPKSPHAARAREVIERSEKKN